MLGCTIMCKRFERNFLSFLFFFSLREHFNSDNEVFLFIYKRSIVKIEDTVLQEQKLAA